MTNESENRIPLADLLFFHRLTRSLTSSFDLSTILRTILLHMEHTIEAELWTLLMMDESGSELTYAIATGGEQEALRGLKVKVGEGVAGWVAEHGETLIVPETERDPRLDSEVSGHPGKIRSVIAMPVRGRKGTHGVIEIFNPRADRMTDYTIAFLHILADHAAIAIENARDMAHIQRLSIIDDCTGLFNARHLYDVLDRELELSKTRGVPVSLVFLDLDRFKLVNDAHGHLVGSELLARTGRRIQELSTRNLTDRRSLCFRYGGDEFVVMMPETGAEAARAFCMRMMDALTHTRFALRNDLHLTVSASAGLATAPADGLTVHAVIGAADARMYEVKSNGRGKIRSA